MLMDDPNKALKYQIFLTLKLWLVLLSHSVEYDILDTVLACLVSWLLGFQTLNYEVC